MSTFEGRLRVEGEGGPDLGVAIDLDGERMKVVAGEVEIADWSLDEIRVAALTDGFHVRAEGEEVVLEVNDDGRFAIDLGLRTAHPALRQRMAALLRDEGSVYGSPTGSADRDTAGP
jgi:hypothetical protein